MTVLEVAAGIMELRNYGIMELRRLCLAKDKCRKAKGGRQPELWIYGLMELRKIGYAEAAPDNKTTSQRDN